MQARRTLLLLRVGAVVVRVMPCAGADAGHTCLHLGHDLQASGIRGHGDLAAGMNEGCRARTAVGHHSRGKGKSRDDLARHGTRGNKHYFRDTGLLRPGACSHSDRINTSGFFPRQCFLNGNCFSRFSFLFFACSASFSSCVRAVL